MIKQEKISISGVPETMLQTMYARAKETMIPFIANLSNKIIVLRK